MSKNGSLDINEIKEQIKLIEDSFCYYVSCNGNVYKKDKHCKFLKKKLNYHKNGYLYTMYINKSGKIITRRVHRLVATAFIENRNNYTIVGEYIDRALTGTNDNRAQFQKMIEDSNKRYFNGILVYQLDRFARNRYDSAIYKSKLKKNNVRVFSAKENINDSENKLNVIN